MDDAPQPAPDPGLPGRVFDAHLHLIDPAYPLVPNDGYLPSTRAPAALWDDAAAFYRLPPSVADA